MTIELTTPEGKKILLENVSIGGQFKWEYYTTNGDRKIYYIRLTNKEASVMNQLTQATNLIVMKNREGRNILVCGQCKEVKPNELISEFNPWNIDWSSEDWIKKYHNGYLVCGWAGIMDECWVFDEENKYCVLAFGIKPNMVMN